MSTAPAPRGVQVLPSGKSYLITGEWPAYTVHQATGGDTRAATLEEAKAIRDQETAERWMSTEVRGCDTALVEALLAAAGSGNLEGGEKTRDLASAFGVESIRNVYPDPTSWTLEACRAWLVERHGQKVAEADHADEWDDVEAIRDLIRDQAEAAEVYEWWRVSEWLATKLDTIGEVTISNEYGHWWGRTCTGQAVVMDGTLQRVAASLYA